MAGKLPYAGKPCLNHGLGKPSRRALIAAAKLFAPPVVQSRALLSVAKAVKRTREAQDGPQGGLDL